MTARAPSRVVIAAADPDYRLLLRLALVPDVRFEVVAETGTAADLAEVAVRVAADLAVIDCDRSDLFAALPAFRAAAPGCRVVLVSGYGDDDLRVASAAAGAVGFLRKSVAASRLGDELAELAAVVGLVQEILLDADLRNAGVARRFVDEALEAGGFGEAAEIVKLLVSELVTNAIVHAGTEVDVAVKLSADTARIEVSDRSDVSPAARVADVDDESGRGLSFVETLAQAWGVRPRRGGGKTIWFEVERPGLVSGRARP